MRLLTHCLSLLEACVSALFASSASAAVAPLRCELQCGTSREAAHMPAGVSHLIRQHHDSLWNLMLEEANNTPSQPLARGQVICRHRDGVDFKGDKSEGP